jgi:hypothetical protein
LIDKASHRYYFKEEVKTMETALTLTDQAVARIRDFAAKMPDPAEKHFRNH